MRPRSALAPAALALALALAVAPAARPAAAQAQAQLPAPAGPAVPLQAPASAEPAVPPAEPGQSEIVPSPGRELGERLWQAAWDNLAGQTLVLGAGYEQGTLKFPAFRGELGANPQITDNGRITLLLRYETQERYFAEYPLRFGKAALGYNLVGSYSQLRVERQLAGSAFVGQGLGTAVQGDYLVAAPQLFVRMGPLYPGRAVFWKFGAGLGAGLVRLSGSVLPRNGTAGEAPQSVGSDGARLAEYINVIWELQVEHWLLAFRSLYLAGRAGSDRYTYEVYSLSLGYGLRF